MYFLFLHFYCGPTFRHSSIFGMLKRLCRSHFVFKQIPKKKDTNYVHYIFLLACLEIMLDTLILGVQTDIQRRKKLKLLIWLRVIRHYQVQRLSQITTSAISNHLGLIMLKVISKWLSILLSLYYF